MQSGEFINARDVREVESELNSYAIHPLVLLNVSEHHTRLTSTTAPPLIPSRPTSAVRSTTPAQTSTRAIGVLLGQQIGKRIEVHTSFDLKVSVASDVDATNNNNIVVDASYMSRKRESMARVFPDYHVVGWYTTGSRLSDYDLRVLHTTIAQVAPEGASTLVILVVHLATPAEGGVGGGSDGGVVGGGGAAASTSSGGTTQLPVYLFETPRDVVVTESHGSAAAQQPVTAPTSASTHNVLSKVIRVAYTVESEESERIGVETARLVDTAAAESATSATTSGAGGGITSGAAAAPGASSIKTQVEGYQSALTMLGARIHVLLAYLRDVDAGRIAPDYTLLRRIATIVNQMPKDDNPNFQRAWLRDYNDAMLVAYLGLLQKGTAMLGKLSADVAEAAANDRRGAKRMLSLR